MINQTARYDRRSFIRRMGVLYGTVLLFPSCGPSERRFRVFTEEEASCLTALCEQIVPADQDPGATDAGVIYYIDKQIDLRFPAEKETFSQGIASVQATCMAEFGKRFEELDWNTQTGLLQKMEKNQLPEVHWTSVRQSSFMNLLIQRTMQGFYGSPRHGGNKNYVSYHMLKLDYPLLIGQNRYRK